MQDSLGTVRSQIQVSVWHRQKLKFRTCWVLSEAKFKDPLSLPMRPPKSGRGILYELYFGVVAGPKRLRRL